MYGNRQYIYGKRQYNYPPLPQIKLEKSSSLLDLV